MSKRFYFGSPSDSDDDTDNLPYPEPLPRSSFLTPDFTPTQFLSSLQNRHQALEDLRTELRTRSQELSKELLDLVNDNYQEFLGLGNDLRGGDQKVEEVRVGLLGFKREIDSLKEKTEVRRKETEALVNDRRDIARELRIGKDLLEIDAKLEELEESLEIKTREADGQAEADGSSVDISLSDESDDSEEEDGTVIPISRLTRRCGRLVEIRRLLQRAGPRHPFILAQQERIKKVRRTLLLDLASTLRQCQKAKRQEKVLKVMKLYDTIGASKEALNVVKSTG